MEQEEEIRRVKKDLANRYITDSEEKRMFFSTPNKDVHDWGCYIAGLVLTQTGKTIFTPAEIKSELKRLISQIYGQMYVRESRILPADVRIDAPGLKGFNVDRTGDQDYAHGFPCLEMIGPKVYKFVGFKEGIRRRYGKYIFKRLLNNPDEPKG